MQHEGQDVGGYRNREPVACPEVLPNVGKVVAEADEPVDALLACAVVQLSSAALSPAGTSLRNAVLPRLAM